MTPLSWAVIRGDADSAELLIDAGANVKSKNRDGSTPLHSAAFLGRAESSRCSSNTAPTPTLVVRQVNLPSIPRRSTGTPTQYIAKLLQIPARHRGRRRRGRRRGPAAAGPITQTTGDATRGGGSAAATEGGLVKAYRRLLDSDRLSVRARRRQAFNLIRTPVFHHLWFLWFLCWLVPIFALIAWAAQGLHLPRVPRAAPLARLLPVAPAADLHSAVVHGRRRADFGPDTSIGILPMPHLLLYYGIFFGFGALYYDANDDEGRLGRRWWFLLPFALIIALPAGPRAARAAARRAVAQVVYAWMMSFGMMGLFRRVLRRERPWVRYVSDSSYWLYITHVPLVIAAQAVVASWPLPSYVKFVLAQRRRDGDPPAVVSTFRSLHVDRLHPERPADTSSSRTASKRPR